MDGPLLQPVGALVGGERRARVHNRCDAGQQQGEGQQVTPQRNPSQPIDEGTGSIIGGRSDRALVAGRPGRSHGGGGHAAAPLSFPAPRTVASTGFGIGNEDVRRARRASEAARTTRTALRATTGRACQPAPKTRSLYDQLVTSVSAMAAANNCPWRFPPRAATITTNGSAHTRNCGDSRRAASSIPITAAPRNSGIAAGDSRKRPGPTATPTPATATAVMRTGSTQPQWPGSTTQLPE